jgi:hypothetical protein
MRPGVRFPIDVKQLRDIDVRVALRGGQLHVAEQFLNGPQVGACLQQMRGKRVSQRVRTDPESRAAARNVARYQPLYAPAGQSPTARVYKKRRPL